MSGDTWLRVILVLVCIAFLLRAASAMCTDAAHAWYERRADIVRWNFSRASYEKSHGEPPPLPDPLPEKPWYVRLHEWGRW